MRIPGDRRLYIKRFQREATALIKLRKMGYAINHLADAFSRSTSFVYRILKNVRETDSTYRKFDKRKSSRNAKLWNARRMLQTLYSYSERWQRFILGLDDEPP